MRLGRLAEASDWDLNMQCKGLGLDGSCRQQGAINHFFTFLNNTILFLIIYIADKIIHNPLDKH